MVFIAKANRQIVGEKKIEGAPDLVVEILSPGAGHYDRVHKKIVYQTSGVKEYWIVDPDERSIEIFQNIGSGFRLGCSTRDGGSAVSTLLSGFSVDPTILFRPILD